MIEIAETKSEAQPQDAVRSVRWLDSERVKSEASSGHVASQRSGGCGECSLTPYYDRNGITIYHGDCRELLCELKHVDMIWTDPPYPVEYLPLYGTLATHAARLLPNTGHCFAYCGQSYLPEVMRLLGEHLEYNWTICCEHRGPKTNVWARGVRSMWKPILWYRRRPLTAPDIQVLDRVHSRRDKVDHEWAQGEEGGLIMEACIVPGGVVLDPFMGTGTTLRVARSHGRRGIGIDVEERCCELAAKRLSQEVFDFTPTVTDTLPTLAACARSSRSETAQESNHRI